VLCLNLFDKIEIFCYNINRVIEKTLLQNHNIMLVIMQNLRFLKFPLKFKVRDCNLVTSNVHEKY